MTIIMHDNIIIRMLFKVDYVCFMQFSARWTVSFSLIPCTLTTMHSPNYPYPWPDIFSLTCFTFPHALQQNVYALLWQGKSLILYIPTPHLTTTHPLTTLTTLPPTFTHLLISLPANAHSSHHCLSPSLATLTIYSPPVLIPVEMFCLKSKCM